MEVYYRREEKNTGVLVNPKVDVRGNVNEEGEDCLGLV